MPIEPNGIEARFDARDLLVSKTDPRGQLTYVNRNFISISGFTEDELLGKPHSIVRHPSMPRCVFDLMWETIQDGREIFAFVVNLAKDGRHYWVFAHVTPDVDPNTIEILGYHSSRRQASASAIRQIEELYALLRREEARGNTKREACSLGRRKLKEILEGRGVTYEQFVMELYDSTTARAA